MKIHLYWDIKSYVYIFFLCFSHCFGPHIVYDSSAAVLKNTNIIYRYPNRSEGLWCRLYWIWPSAQVAIPTSARLTIHTNLSLIFMEEKYEYTYNIYKCTYTYITIFLQNAQLNTFINSNYLNFETWHLLWISQCFYKQLWKTQKKVFIWSVVQSFRNKNIKVYLNLKTIFRQQLKIFA